MGTRPAAVAVGQQATAAQYNALRTALTLISSGSYVGNNTVNRAIPHGLGETPKLVIIINEASATVADFFRIVGGVAKIYNNRGVVYIYAVTAPDAVNFYVGNATEYRGSGNYTGYQHYWVAFA